ncbi:MAG: thymidine phosphorylase [Planctomycetia bacterium]
MSHAPLPAEVIEAKREGRELSSAQVQAFARGIVDGSWADAQVGAMAMALLLRGMTRHECVELTHAMVHTGAVLDWSAQNLPGPTLDKHSTGGVGDKVSLLLAPLVAACGGFVPMASGRGLGHTGGTLDKLEALPGYDVCADEATFRRVVAEAGCAIVGPTASLAPADARLYAIRDVTATVESTPLITASILCKKLAEGVTGGLVMDVKVGTGAFSPTLARARELATSIVEVACGAGLPTSALITDMDAVLGRTAGNALEVQETLEVLTGGPCEERLREVTLALCSEMLVLGRLAHDGGEARQRLEAALSSGAAAERFARMVHGLGGPASLLERWRELLPRAPVVLPVLPGRPGLVGALDVKALGMAVVALGGGRRRPGDDIDPAVGLSHVLRPGEPTGPGQPLAQVHARTAAEAEVAARAVRAAMPVVDAAPPVLPIVRERIGPVPA